MKTLFDDLLQEISCDCGHKLSETISRLKDDPNLICPACGVGIVVKMDNLLRSLAETQKAIDDIPRKLTFNFKF